MHATHRPGTDADCSDCMDLVYEPSWYAALVAFATDDVTIVHRDAVPAS